MHKVNIIRIESAMNAGKKNKACMHDEFYCTLYYSLLFSFDHFDLHWFLRSEDSLLTQLQLLNIR